MSVTNDPNYHEGQPAFQAAAKGEAYQPTSDHLDRNNPPQGSETGATCPWCDRIRLLFKAMKDAEYHLVCGENEFSRAAQGAVRDAGDALHKALAELPSPRPLPDFPAGTLEDINTALAELEYIGLMGIDSIEKAVKRAKRLLVNLRSLALQARYHAPARPAAAGLTLSDEQTEECVKMGLEAYQRDGMVYHAQVVDAIRAALAHAESLLSSRATEAEVDIPEPEGRDRMQIMGNRPPQSWSDEECATYKRTLDYARRHATMRTGGGE